MIFKRKIRSFHKDLKRYDSNNHQPYNASLLKFLWKRFIKGTWDTIELDDEYLEDVDILPNKKYLQRNAMFLLELNKKYKYLTLKHLRIFAKDKKYLTTTFPRFVQQLMSIYGKRGYDRIVIYLNSENDSYTVYFNNYVSNLQFSPGLNLDIQTKTKKNYYILVFKFDTK